MTTEVDIVNRALQTIGTRTTVTAPQLAGNLNNEAIQANLVLARYRDQLLRMAPWACGFKYANAIYLTSTPGTPENSSPVTSTWQPGQPAPPWAYEYWYPDDCLKMCYIIPGQQSGFAGVPITAAVTGGAPSFWQGGPIKFKISTDQFYSALTFTIANGGNGFAPNDIAIFGGAPSVTGELPAGLINVKVLTVGGTGNILTAQLENFTTLNKNSLLLQFPTYDFDQVYTQGFGQNAVMHISSTGVTRSDARVILTNQEFATLAYVKQVTDPNVMDDLFMEAWVNVLGAGICMALTGDKALANDRIGSANLRIQEARKADGNEGLTINDVTPDFIRTRGIAWTEYYTSWSQFDWGQYWPVY